MVCDIPSPYMEKIINKDEPFYGYIQRVKKEPLFLKCKKFNEVFGYNP